MDNKYVISLEIGSSAVQVAAATYSEDNAGVVTVIGAEEEPLSNCVRYGRIQNVDEVASRTLVALDRLRAIPELADHTITGVYAAIGGRSLHSVKACAELSFLEETRITAEIVERLQEDALKSIDEQIDALDVIPLRYIVNNQTTDNPIGWFSNQIKAEFNVIVCRSLNTRNLERVVSDRLGLDICGLVVRPVAIADMCLTVEDTEPGCMLVDLGAETTTVSIYKNRALQYLATIPLGAASITRDLASCLGVIESQAEQTKRNLANAMPDSNSAGTAELRNIGNYVNARVMEIIANIKAQIEYAGFAATDLRAGIIITGRGAKLRNFCKLLEQQSALKVRTIALPPTVRLASADLNANDLVASIAVAVRGTEYAEEPDALPCVEEPVYISAPVENDEQPEQQPEQPKAEEQPAKETARPAYSLDRDEYDENDADDDDSDDDKYLLEDDDEAERLRAMEQQKREVDARRRDEERRIKEQRLRNNNNEKDDEDIEDVPGVRPERTSILARLRNRVDSLIQKIDADSDDSNSLDD